MSDTTVEHGDVFESIRSLADDSAHCAVVDYPWEFCENNGTGRFGNEDVPHNVREMPFQEESEDRFSGLLAELARVLVNGAWCICMADDRFQDVVREALRESEFTLRRNWAWTPESMGMGHYGRINHYPIPVATLGETDRYVTDRSTLFRVPGGRQTEYPTGKPTELYRQLLRPPVIEDDETLLEPFCGGGPGAAVANERGLSYWGCDVDADAVDRTTERFEQQSLRGQLTLADGGDR